MKKYNDPRFEMHMFDNESVVTLSAETTYEDWAQKNNADTIELDFSDFADMSV